MSNVDISLDDANLGFTIIGRPSAGKTFFLQRTLVPSLARAHREAGDPAGFFALEAKGSSETQGWVGALSGMNRIIVDPRIRAPERDRVPFSLLAAGGEALASALWPLAEIAVAGTAKFYLEKAHELVRLAADAALLGGPVALADIAAVIYSRTLDPLCEVAAAKGRPELSAELGKFVRMSSKDYDAVVEGIKNPFGRLSTTAAYYVAQGSSAAECIERPVAVIFSAPLALGSAHELIVRSALGQLVTAIRMSHLHMRHRVYLVLDEAPTLAGAGGGSGIGAGGLLRELLTTGRSAGCSIIFGAQSPEALDQLHLLDLADVVGTIILFPTGQSPVALERFARRAGVEYRTATDSSGLPYPEVTLRFRAEELVAWPPRRALALITCNGHLWPRAIELEAVDLTRPAPGVSERQPPWHRWLCAVMDRLGI